MLLQKKKERVDSLSSIYNVLNIYPLSENFHAMSNSYTNPGPLLLAVKKLAWLHPQVKF